MTASLSVYAQLFKHEGWLQVFFKIIILFHQILQSISQLRFRTSASYYSIRSLRPRLLATCQNWIFCQFVFALNLLFVTDYAGSFYYVKFLSHSLVACVILIGISDLAILQTFLKFQLNAFFQERMIDSKVLDQVLPASEYISVKIVIILSHQQQKFINMLSQYNRQADTKLYPLSERGFRQASRNNSHQIWTLFSWSTEDDQKQYDETFCTNNDEKEKNNQNVEDQLQKNVNKDKEKIRLSEIPPNKKEEAIKITKNPKDSNQENQNMFKRSLKVAKKARIAPPVLTQQQSQFQRLKRKSIEKYIRQQVPFTRTLSNSAFKKFYQRPCPETYGNKNVNSGGVCYGNFMKTHNIQPHTLENKPEHYQTFTSALNFGKRTKLDLQDRWKKIQRQLAKNLDFKQTVYMKAVGQIQMNQTNKATILKENINKYGQEDGQAFKQQIVENRLSKTSKSLDKLGVTRATLKDTIKEPSRSAQKQVGQHNKGLKSSDRSLYYIYKYQEGDENYNYTRYARDRHGITCYVDHCFKENDQAYVNFLKKIKPIYSEKCKPEDMNIDNIRIKNNEISKQENIPRHYLIPNCEEPYNSTRYSRQKITNLAETSI